jgi:hypothetical protein
VSKQIAAHRKLSKLDRSAKSLIEDSLAKNAKGM